MRKTAVFRKTNKLRKTQRGGGLKILGFDDAAAAANKYLKTPQCDKNKNRLSIYQKTKNLKELLSEIYARKGNILKAFKKSNTPIFTQVSKRFFANKYDNAWFEKNLVSVEQIDDYIKDDLLFCQTLSTYLKELYIIITWDTTKFVRQDTSTIANWKDFFICEDVILPELEFTSEDHRIILEKIFKKAGVMDNFVLNYNVVKAKFETHYSTATEVGASTTEDRASTTEVGASTTEVGASTTELEKQNLEIDNLEKERDEELDKLEKLKELNETNNPLLQSNLERQIKKIETIEIALVKLYVKQYKDTMRERRKNEQKENEQMGKKDTKKEEEKPAGGRRRNQTKKRNKRNKSNKK
jgi:hypothetical protein